MKLTIRERAQAYNDAFPKFPAGHLHVVQEQGRDVLYGVWSFGQDFRNKSTFYGAYPGNYLQRIGALYPDVDEADILHVFSGSLPKGRYTRCDLVQDAELRCSVYDIRQHTDGRWPLQFADPPYTKADAAKYGTGMVDRRRATAALADVAVPRGHLVWLDTCWPQHRKDAWVTVGQIFIRRSTNHRFRAVSIFERVA